ncbi:ATP synthase subunit delta, mitochondrial-like [Watersipora subatra]|uniref:ATP synthase subunit delta, mitochondrial-like n=1 Tax=Watersipora subatra TaxID=2589382 RepID=UPI00355AFF0D
MAFSRACCRFVQFSQQSAATRAVISKRGYADGAVAMAFTFATPSECFYTNANVKQVDVPALSGDFGIVAKHVPTLAVLKPGVVVVHEEEATHKYFVSSGSVTVNDDSSVQILAEEATPLNRLDIAAVRDGLAKAQQEQSSASSEQAKAEAQIAVECFEAMQTALS